MGASPTYAGFRRRILAFVCDYLFIAAYLVVLVVAGWSLSYTQYSAAVRALFANPIYGETTGFLLLTLPVALYFALQEGSKQEATWGKRKVRLRVTDMNGNRLTVKRSLLRSGIKFAPWELSHAIIFRIPGGIFGATSFPPILGVGLSVVWILVFIYVIAAFIGRKHQTLYDRIAGTVVVSTA